MSISSEQRFAVVTGASKGIGRATALALVKDHGCRVLAVARDTQALASLADECRAIDGHLETVVLDLAEEGSLSRIRSAVNGRRVHALINNAGLLIKRPFGTWSTEDLQDLFLTNCFVPVRLTQLLVEDLAGEPPGHVVNIGSMGGFPGSAKFPGLLGYSASKAALANVTECIAEELKDKQVRCNCLCIGAVDTAMLREAFPDYHAQVDETTMGGYVARFAMQGQQVFNGKVLPLALSTP